jgi:hypothetical protein
MEKSAQSGESGGSRAPLFTLSAITYKVVVYAPAERYTPPISTLLLYELCVLDFIVMFVLYLQVRGWPIREEI